MSHLQQDQLLARTAELHYANFVLLPLGKGDSGKAPVIRDWQNSALSLAKFEKRMTDKASLMYGVRLDGMVVLDIDAKDPDLISRLEARFGVASVKVETPRGFHLYYSGWPINLPKLKEEDFRVDVLAGQRHYVVGPTSIRPCGGRYVEICGKLGLTKLNPFPETASQSLEGIDMTFSRQFRADGKVTEGHRNEHLWKRAIEFVQACETEDELFGDLVHVRDDDCENPETCEDKELKGIARWAFNLSAEGRLHAVTRGIYQVDRRFTELLSRDSNALALYVVLKSNFGHIPKKHFLLCYKGMMAAGLINMSKNRFAAAIKLLSQTGAIVIAEQYYVGKRKRTYALGQAPHPTFPTVTSAVPDSDIDG